MHEVSNREVGDVLLCGVFDGHGGTAASESVSQILPPLFSEELELSSEEGKTAIKTALEKSWDLTCTTYRNLCEDGECVVDYDPMEGILFAETGSKDLIGKCSIGLIVDLCLIVDLWPSLDTYQFMIRSSLDCSWNYCDIGCNLTEPKRNKRADCTELRRLENNISR